MIIPQLPKKSFDGWNLIKRAECLSSNLKTAETTTLPTTTVESVTTGAPPDLYGLGLPGSVSCPPGYEVLTDQQECETQVTEWASMPFDIVGMAH